MKKQRKEGREEGPGGPAGSDLTLESDQLCVPRGLHDGVFAGIDVLLQLSVDPA